MTKTKRNAQNKTKKRINKIKENVVDTNRGIEKITRVTSGKNGF